MCASCQTLFAKFLLKLQLTHEKMDTKLSENMKMNQKCGLAYKMNLLLLFTHTDLGITEMSKFSPKKTPTSLFFILLLLLSAFSGEFV